MAFLIFLGLVVGTIVLIAVLKAKSRMHFVNETRATRDLINGAGPTLPSWHGDQTKLEIFSDGVARLAQRDGIPIPFTRLALSNSKSNGPIFAFAAKLEYQGSSFTEQQLGTSRFLLTTWNELDASEKAKIARMVAA